MSGVRKKTQSYFITVDHILLLLIYHTRTQSVSHIIIIQILVLVGIINSFIISFRNL